MNKKRVFIQFSVIILFFGLIVARLFYLQIWNHVEIQKRVDRLTKRNKAEDIQRGTIFDRNGKVLAVSVKKYKVFVDLQCVENKNEIIDALKEAGIDFNTAVLAENKNKSYVPVANEITLEVVERLKKRKLRAIGYVPQYVRQYPEGRLACHVLGSVGKDKYGLEGVEYSANEYLSGKKINNPKQRDGRGREIPDRILKEVQLRGSDVYLTIDRNLQFIAEQEIDTAYKDSSAKKAMVIIQDSATGELLALACRPAFHPGDLKPGQSMRNPAVSDIFEPGSTFKAVTAAAVLSENLAGRNETFWCENGKFSIFNHVIKDHEKKGMLSFDQVMEFSSNIGMAKLGLRLGREKLYHYTRLFGFNSLTGIDLPGEAKGLLKEPLAWSGLSLPVIAFGQEIGVTAVQMVNAYSAIFNGGMLFEPRVIKKITDRNKRVIYESAPREIRRVVSKDISDDLRDIMVKTVENGTGQLAKIPFYSVGGKTGTAQKRDPKTKRYSSSLYVASFCGAIPALADQNLTILVVIDEPKGDYWGASRAVPVFKRIAARAVQYLRILPDKKPVENIDQASKRGVK